MKKFLTPMLTAVALGAVCTSASALPVMPELLQEPSKPAVHYRFLNDTPTVGATITLPGFDREGRTQGNGEVVPFAFLNTDSKKTYKAPAEPARALALKVKVIGQLIYDQGKEYDPDNNDWLGFYSLPHSTGASWTLAGYTNGPINRGGYADFDEKVYRGVFQQNYGNIIAFKYLVTFDINTFETIEAKELPTTDFSLTGTAVAKSPSDNKVYGCFYRADGTGFFWGTVDYLAQTNTTIAELDLDKRLVGLTFSDEGVAYGLRETSFGSHSIELVTIDPATGKQEFVAKTQLPHQYGFGTCWNADNKTILATYNTEGNGSGLMEIDPVTGATTLLSDFEADRQVVNLFIKPDYQAKVPAAPEITVTAPEGTMTCAYTITLPTTLADGTPITGNVDWKITNDGKIMAEGNDMQGSQKTGTFTVETPGYHEFLASCSNNNGQSDNAKARLFVGKGLCAAPQNVTLSWNESASTMSASWDAVTTSADGGYINPAEVTYTVTDQNGTQLATGLSATTFSLEMEAPFAHTEFVWSVTAEYNGLSSAPGSSNSVFLGAMVPPYDYDFTMRKEFLNDGYTIIDANNDGVCFDTNGLGARCGHSDQKINMDDWLVLPGIYLEAGKSYLFTLTVHCYQNTDAEIVEAKYGTAPTVAGMTTTLISQTTIKSNRLEPSILTGVVTPTADGIQYIGIHAKSTANKGNTTFHVMVPRVSLGTAMNPKCPNAPTNVKLNAIADGSLRASVSYTAPSTSMGGTSYAAGPAGPPTMLKMMVFVGDEEQPRQTVTVPGGYSGSFPQAVDFTERGDQTVSVVAETPDGYRSIATEATAYVGPYEPKAPTNVRITEVFQPGTLRIEWDAVTQDVSSNALPAGHTTYMIYGYDEDGEPVPMLAEPLADQTSYVFNALENVFNQRYVRYAVSAYNWDFESRKTASNYMPIGVPYTLPVKYSNINDLRTKACAIGTQGYGQFGVFQEGAIPAQDGDGEFFGSRAQYTNDAGILRTGIISLVGAKNPEVVLYTYKIADGDRNIVQCAVWSNGYREVIRFDRHDDMPVGEWTKVRYDLSKWKDKNVQIEITMGCLSISDTYVDNIVICDAPDLDLALTAIDAPARVAAGKEFKIAACVENIGKKDAGEFDVTLLADGNPVDTRHFNDLAVDSTLTVEFTQMLNLFTEGNKTDYTVTVSMTDDAVAENNTSATATVMRQISTLPAPETISGESKDEGNLITWLPATDSSEETVTESFEDGEAWTDFYGDWTFIDRDGSPLGTINEIEIPCVEHGVTRGSFFVFDTTDLPAGAPVNLNAHSGTSFIFSMYRRDNRSVDDWAISPLLNGKEQTITFYAKSLTARYSEQIEVLYTFSDNFVYEEYTKVDGFGTKMVSEEWTLFTALIPEGAKHFAIRSRAANGMMLLVDDVTFGPARPDLKGYNIYRDGTLLNAQPVAETSYLDTEALYQPHVYNVSAVYTDGESELSQSITLERTSVTDIFDGSDIIITVNGLEITVSNAADTAVAISAVDGRQLFAANGDCRYSVPAPGVYLLTAGNRTAKLLVK